MRWREGNGGRPCVPSWVRASPPPAADRSRAPPLYGRSAGGKVLRPHLRWRLRERSHPWSGAAPSWRQLGFGLPCVAPSPGSDRSVPWGCPEARLSLRLTAAPCCGPLYSLSSAYAPPRGTTVFCWRAAFTAAEGPLTGAGRALRRGMACASFAAVPSAACVPYVNLNNGRKRFSKLCLISFR